MVRIATPAKSPQKRVPPLSCGFGTRCAPTLRGLVRRVAGNLRRLTRRHQTRWGSSADISRSSPHRGQGTVKPWLQARRHLWHLSNMPCRLILVGLQFWLLFRRRTAEAKEILVVTERAEEHLQQGFHRVACQIGEEGCVRATGHVMAEPLLDGVTHHLVINCSGTMRWRRAPCTSPMIPRSPCGVDGANFCEGPNVAFNR